MSVTDAQAFLSQFAGRFVAAEVQVWEWDKDAEVWGKRAAWTLGDGVVTQATASVELMAGQLQLHVSERDLSGDEQDAQTVFEALISFDDRTVTVDGVTLPYTDGSIEAVIDRFNEVS
ncbi:MULTISPECIES: hypothetical protein [Cupriavidus]